MSGYDVEESFTQQKEPEITTASDEKQLIEELKKLDSQFRKSQKNPENIFAYDSAIPDHIKTQFKKPVGKEQVEARKVGEYWYKYVNWNAKDPEKPPNYALYRMTDEQHTKEKEKYGNNNTSKSGYKEFARYRIIAAEIATNPQAINEFIKAGFEPFGKNGNESNVILSLGDKPETKIDIHGVMMVKKVKET